MCTDNHGPDAFSDLSTTLESGKYGVWTVGYGREEAGGGAGD